MYIVWLLLFSLVTYNMLDWYHTDFTLYLGVGEMNPIFEYISSLFDITIEKSIFFIKTIFSVILIITIFFWGRKYKISKV